MIWVRSHAIMADRKTEKLYFQNPPWNKRPRGAKWYSRNQRIWISSGTNQRSSNTGNYRTRLQLRRKPRKLPPTQRILSERQHYGPKRIRWRWWMWRSERSSDEIEIQTGTRPCRIRKQKQINSHCTYRAIHPLFTSNWRRLVSDYPQQPATNLHKLPRTWSLPKKLSVNRMLHL